MRIAVISHLKHPIAKPYCGGLEMFTHAFTAGLVARGHDVVLFASGDSDPQLPVEPLVRHSTMSTRFRGQATANHTQIEATEDRVYEQLMKRLLEGGFDVVHNHSLNPIPLHYAQLLPMPMATTLHVPPLPRLVGELQGMRPSGLFVNISRSNARSWKHLLPRQKIIHNGIDVDFWRCPRLPKLHRTVWFGRILPDKGPHLAIEAARHAGMPIDVVGPVDDQHYFETEILPRFSSEDQFHGHLPHEALRRLISRAAVALVTPCWDEPFGLVVIEALACGTPVAGFARGALPELITPEVGRLVDPGDAVSLGRAAVDACRLSGRACRKLICRRYSLAHMIDRYEQLYERACFKAAA